MNYSYVPGRLRVRDPILRDIDIRNAVIKAASVICDKAEISYTEKTSGILALYPPDIVDINKLKAIIPLLLKIEPKVRFYTPKKKQVILDGIAEIENKLKEIFNK